MQSHVNTQILCVELMIKIQDRGTEKGLKKRKKLWLPTFVHCLQFALTLVPSGELPLYRSGRGRWVVNRGCERSSRQHLLRGIHMDFKGCFDDISACLSN